MMKRHKFSDAPGQPDGMIRSRWADQSVPFGQPFKYTDATDLPGEFLPKKPWYKRIFTRLRRKKVLVAWAVVDPQPGQAFIALKGQAVVKSIFSPGSLTPVYDWKSLEIADRYERENPNAPTT